MFHDQKTTYNTFMMKISMTEQTQALETQFLVKSLL